MVIGRFLLLDVNNDGGKYISARKFGHKLWAFIARVEKSSPFQFNITHSEINQKQAEEIVAIINKRAKGKPPDRQEAEKPPFAAD